MTTISIIPARGGSKGIPRKNIKLLAGKPLISYTIETSLRCKSIERTIVSTDDKEIAEVAKKYGAEVPFIRPKELALDTTPMFPVLQHAVEFMENNEKLDIDIVVLLDPTAPFRSADDIEKCISRIKAGADSALTVCESEHNPYFVMVELRNGRICPVLKPEKTITRRQDAPKVYRINACVYAVKRDMLMEKNKIFMENSSAIIMPQERSVHIDHEIDFEFAEFLMKKRGEK